MNDGLTNWAVRQRGNLCARRSPGAGANALIRSGCRGRSESDCRRTGIEAFRLRRETARTADGRRCGQTAESRRFHCRRHLPSAVRIVCPLPSLVPRRLPSNGELALSGCMPSPARRPRCLRVPSRARPPRRGRRHHPAASGGAKWLALAGLDRYLFGELLQRPRNRPMHPSAHRSAVGAWRARAARSRRRVRPRAPGVHLRAAVHVEASTAEVSAVLGRALDLMLGPPASMRSEPSVGEASHHHRRGAWSGGKRASVAAHGGDGAGRRGQSGEPSRTRARHATMDLQPAGDETPLGTSPICRRDTRP
jgi:hypothetical protein